MGGFNPTEPRITWAVLHVHVPYSPQFTLTLPHGARVLDVAVQYRMDPIKQTMSYHPFLAIFAPKQTAADGGKVRTFRMVRDGDEVLPSTADKLVYLASFVHGKEKLRHYLFEEVEELEGDL